MQGIYTAVITAFDKNGSVDEKGMREIVRHCIDRNRADGLFVGGTMGERYKMSLPTVKRALEIVADENKGEVNLVSNISALSREEILDLAKVSKDLRYSAVGLIPPIFHKYTQDEIVKFYEDIAETIELPLMVYVIPSFSYVEFNEEMLKRLLAHPNIKGIKYTHNDYYLLDRVRVNSPNAVLFTGFDDVLYHALLMGTNGAIGGTFNITGLFAKKLYDSIKKGDYQKALRYQRNINDIEDLLNQTGLFSTIKATMIEFGVSCGELSWPSGGITKEQKQQAKIICKYIEENEKL